MIICLECGGSFAQVNGFPVAQKYCSKKCSSKAAKKRHSQRLIDARPVVSWCVICGSGIQGKHAKLKKTCSDTCWKESERRRKKDLRLRTSDEINTRQRERYHAKRAAFLLAHKDEIAARDVKRALAAKDMHREANKRQRLKNPEKYRHLSKERSKRDRERLCDSYVAELLTQKTNLRREHIPQGLIEVKREQLRILKFLKENDHENR